MKKNTTVIKGIAIPVISLIIMICVSGITLTVSTKILDSHYYVSSYIRKKLSSTDPRLDKYNEIWNNILYISLGIGLTISQSTVWLVFSTNRRNME